MSTEYERTRNLIIVVAIVIIILAILRIAGIGLTGAKPLRDTATGYAFMVISIIVVAAILWYYRKK
ncbi:MAG: hypothetical protein ACE5R6_17070 [Candidatus Heimdallarchaeota archaeon]